MPQRADMTVSFSTGRSIRRDLKALGFVDGDGVFVHASMSAIAEAFRTWPGTVRSHHPAVSVCLNGKEAERYASPHTLAWATGPGTLFGRLCLRPNMKVLLVGVGWKRCTALHMAETTAEPKRTKTRRFKASSPSGEWMETTDVADDVDRLFPSVGEAVTRVCDYGSLIAFAAQRIGEANLASSDRH